MRGVAVIPLGLLLAGAVLVITSVAAGETDVSLVFFFPVLSGSSLYFLLGVGMIVAGTMAGFMVIWYSAVGTPGSRERESARRQLSGSAAADRRYGGVVLIGPIPIAFGSSSKMAYAMLGVGIVVIIILVVLFLIAPL